MKMTKTVFILYLCGSYVVGTAQGVGLGEQASSLGFVAIAALFYLMAIILHIRSQE